MNRRWKTLLQLVLATVLSSCGDERIVTTGEVGNNITNNATNVVSGSNQNNTNNVMGWEIELGRVTIFIEDAQQLDESNYEVHVWIGNGLDESIPIGPEQFRLVYESGLLAASHGSMNASNCPQSERLSANAAHRCKLTFTDAVELPSQIVYLGSGPEIYVALEYTRCETCGTDACVNLNTNPLHCGVCFNRALVPETCDSGELHCPESNKFGAFCLPDNQYEIIENPVGSQWSCIEQCEFNRTCAGVLLKVSCPPGNVAYDGTERTLPGLMLCSLTGAELAALPSANGCSLDEVGCVCSSGD